MDLLFVWQLPGREAAAVDGGNVASRRAGATFAAWNERSSSSVKLGSFFLTCAAAETHRGITFISITLKSVCMSSGDCGAFALPILTDKLESVFKHPAVEPSQ